jgi:hypothetical protein
MLNIVALPPLVHFRQGAYRFFFSSWPPSSSACVITQTQESTPTVAVARGGVASGRVASAAGRVAVG